MLHVLAILLAVAAAVFMVFAIAGMVTHNQSDRTGFALRLAALACFGAAVVLNVIAH
jgi:hypothetical protein